MKLLIVETRELRMFSPAIYVGNLEPFLERSINSISRRVEDTDGTSLAMMVLDQEVDVEAEAGAEAGAEMVAESEEEEEAFWLNEKVLFN